MSRFYEPINSFIERDCDPLRKRILGLVYASIYADESSDVTKCLLRAYDQQCDADEQPEHPSLEGSAAWEYMRSVYLKRRKAQGLCYDIASEEFEWPQALPTNYPIRKGILKSVGLRMAAADHYLRRQMQQAYLSEQAKAVTT